MQIILLWNCKPNKWPAYCIQGFPDTVFNVLCLRSVYWNNIQYWLGLVNRWINLKSAEVPKAEKKKAFGYSYNRETPTRSAVMMTPCNLKQISWFECAALTAVYTPTAYPRRIPGWQNVFRCASIYAAAITFPCELGAPEDLRRGNIRHKTCSQAAAVFAAFPSALNESVVFLRLHTNNRTVVNSHSWRLSVWESSILLHKCTQCCLFQQDKSQWARAVSRWIAKKNPLCLPSFSSFLWVLVIQPVWQRASVDGAYSQPSSIQTQ